MQNEGMVKACYHENVNFKYYSGVFNNLKTKLCHCLFTWPLQFLQGEYKVGQHLGLCSAGQSYMLMWSVLFSIFV